tara:strand:- start:504 stop:1019 length:516 start_codon:yes stop_codon:yes gene_type:complete
MYSPSQGPAGENGDESDVPSSNTTTSSSTATESATAAAADGAAPGVQDVEKDLSQKRARISNFLRKWTMSSVSDFLENEEELKLQYEEWLASPPFKEREHIGIAKLLSKALQKTLDGISTGSTVFSEKPPVPIVPKKANFSLLDLDPNELARQLTLVCSRLYQVREVGIGV